MLPYNNPHQMIHCLPRFYGGRILFVHSTYGSNSYEGIDPASPVKSITYALTKCVDEADDLIVVLNGYSNDNTDTETNGDDSPITVDKNGVTILFQGRNNLLTPIADGDEMFKLDANQVTIGVLPGGAMLLVAATAGTTATAFAFQAAAVDCEVFGAKCNSTLGNYDEVVTISATAHKARLHDCWFIGDTTDTDEGIMIEGTCDQLWVHDNVIVSCGAANGGLYSNSAHTNCRIEHNHFDEQVASKKAVNFAAAATGVIRYNTLYAAADANTIVNGNCAEYENYGNDAFTTAGFIVPAAGTITSDARLKVDIIYL